MVKKILLIFILLFSCNSFAQDISAKASTDSTEYLVGDFIHFKIFAKYDKSIKIIPPAIPDSLNQIEIIKTEDPVYKNIAGQKYAGFNFVLAAYDSADVIIPPINIYYRVGKDTLKNSGIELKDETLKSLQTNSVSFRINLVKVDLQKDIKDVKDPQKIPFNWTTLIIWILAGLVIIGILIYLYIKYRQKKSGKPVVKKIIKLPPHVAALNSLKELEEKKLWQNGKIKEYHSEITGIIRKYFSERFGLPALELTTSETLVLLRNKKEAEVILSSTQSFLENADLVKFAKFSPLQSVNEEMMKQAYQIVETTAIKNEPKVNTEEKDV